MTLGIGFIFWLAVGLILFIRGLSLLGVTAAALRIVEGISWCAAGIVVVVVQGIP